MFPKVAPRSPLKSHHVKTVSPIPPPKMPRKENGAQKLTNFQVTKLNLKTLFWNLFVWSVSFANICFIKLLNILMMHWKFISINNYFKTGKLFNVWQIISFTTKAAYWYKRVSSQIFHCAVEITVGKTFPFAI